MKTQKTKNSLGRPRVFKKRQTYGFSLEQEDLKELRRRAAEQGTTPSAVARSAIRTYLYQQQD